MIWAEFWSFLKPQVTFEASQYVAVFDEGIWKRAYIEEVNTQNYQVQLIDYGKSDIIPEKRVKEQVLCIHFIIEYASRNLT